MMASPGFTAAASPTRWAARIFSAMVIGRAGVSTAGGSTTGGPGTTGVDLDTTADGSGSTGGGPKLDVGSAIDLGGGGMPGTIPTTCATAEQFETISQMTPVSDAQGFIVAYGQGIQNSWNAGKCCGTASAQKVLDVQFASDIIDTLAGVLCIDQKRVYAAGFSNGGMLSNRLACDLSNRIAAFAPVAGPLAMDGCNPTRFMPMIEFHGTGDFVVPYNGGGLGGAVSVPENFAFWSKNAACTDKNPAQVYDNGDTQCVEASQCQGGAAVRLCTVNNGGHQWPGGKSAGPTGKLTQDINASEEMLKFFLAHPLP